MAPFSFTKIVPHEPTKERRSTKITRSPEWQEIQERLPTLKKGEALLVTLSDQLVNSEYGGNHRRALVSFKTKLYDLYKNAYRVRLTKNGQLAVSNRKANGL